ncbi:hypothetical protein UPYG_G00294990 [Umbra pygmaea]|uniref:BZIP domain-containing protein n=1 Tax=Umbra pygmaea TaxID=75934 RepID=A0ABD0WA20_UMBPY
MELMKLLNQTGRTLSCHGHHTWQISAPGSLSPVGGGDDFLDILLGDIVSSAPISPFWPSSQSDSGLSEEPTSGSDDLDSPNQPAGSASQAFYPDLPGVYLTQPAPDISIDLAGWESGLFQETTYNPWLSSAHSLTIKDLLLSGIRDPESSQHPLKELLLNEDEKKLLAKEGVQLPCQMPLTKLEEKVLKKVRRKIRNKQSAQESRKKKRLYVDSLEGRMEACSTQNMELQRKVHQLEETNRSLLEQLARLQSLLPNGSSKSAQKGTCILILLLSFSLLLPPSLQPDPHSSASQEGHVTLTRGRSRSLLAAVDTELPAFSLARGVEVLLTLVEKLRVRPEYSDPDPQTIYDHKHYL